MSITKVQIAGIARATKDNCHPDGFGACVNVFADGSWLYGHSENDVIARGADGDGWDYRIACLRYPMTRATVAEALANAAD